MVGLPVGVKLILEVLDHAPEDLTAGDRLLMVVLAEQANDLTRRCWPGWELIARRMHWDGNKDGGKNAVSTALARMAERGVEVRVALAKDGAGRPVYAVRGKRTTYRIPEFAGAERAAWVDESATQAERVDESATQSGSTCENSGEWVDSPATHEWVDDSATHQANGWQSSGAKGGSSEGQRVDESATPSPQEPSGNPQAQSGPPPRYGEDLSVVPEPLRTVAQSLATTHPDTTLADARAVLALVAKKHQPKGTRYFTIIAEGGGFGRYLDEVRATQRGEHTKRSKVTEERIKKLKRTEPPCEHGQEAGRAPHPVHGTPLCPECRRGTPARTEADRPTTSPEVTAVLDAYHLAAKEHGHRVSAQDLVALTSQIGMFLNQGADPALVARVASTAGASGVDILTQLKTSRRAA